MILQGSFRQEMVASAREKGHVWKLPMMRTSEEETKVYYSRMKF
ncbi:hypothetical protein AAZX31_12G076900 [Glycine max]